MFSVLHGIGVLLMLAALPTIFELFLTTLGSLLSCVRCAKELDDISIFQGKIAIVIPAHNEELLIERTLVSLEGVDDPSGNHVVVVVCDHCTDRTSEICKKRGVEIIERRGEQTRGKGAALREAFSVLGALEFEAFFVIDADSVVSSNALQVIREAIGQGADAIQIGDLPPEEISSGRNQLISLAFTAFNLIRPLGRQYWGLSTGILGNGFVLTRRLLDRVPYNTDSLVEDLAYHMELILAGEKVIFCPEAVARASLPTGLVAEQVQRSRWEGGRLRVCLDYFASLYRAIPARKFHAIEALLELTSLPLAYLTILLGTAFILGGPGRVVAVVGAFVLAVHVILALRWAPKGVRAGTVLFSVWKYLFWKIQMLPTTIRGASVNAAWKRTRRDVE